MKPQKVKFDKYRPVFFGWSAIEKFEEMTDIPFAEMGEALQNMKATVLIAFIYAGLYGGAKKTKTAIDFDREDVINWLDEVDNLELVMKSYIDCMPISGSESKGESVHGAKKK